MERQLKTKYEPSDFLAAAARRFKPRGGLVNIREYGHGNVHDTFLVTLEGGEAEHFILQRVNTQVFRQPEQVMRNMRIVTDHVSGRLERDQPCRGRRWEVVRVLSDEAGLDYWIAPDGDFWRAISFIGGAESFDIIQNSEHAREVGFALGMFHSLVSDLPAGKLADTLEGFHITPRYLRHYDRVLEEKGAGRSPEEKYALRFVNEQRALADVLEEAKMQGRLCLRPIHGDPKVNNFMIDTTTGRAVSMIDLDTVKPGLVHYDIGDCLRSCCNLLGEETEQWEAVQFDPDLCRTILHGYLPVAKNFLSEMDYEYLYDGVRLIALELGLRFFTDYLEGNVYFKVSHPKHNLARALVQFRLAESIESQEKTICAMFRDMR